ERVHARVVLLTVRMEVSLQAGSNEMARCAAYLVVGGIDQNLIEDLEETGNVGDLPDVVAVRERDGAAPARAPLLTGAPSACPPSRTPTSWQTCGLPIQYRYRVSTGRARVA